MKPDFSLYYLTLNVTSRCNLNCIHCYNDKYTTEGGELSTEEVLDILNQISRMNVKYVLFTGGEPLLRKDIFYLLGYAKNKKISVFLATNGILINKEIIKKLKGIVNKINISIDSIGVKHDKIRGKKGSFRLALKAIRLAKKQEIDIGVSFTAHKKNIDEIYQVAKMCKKLKVPMTIKRFIPIGAGKKLSLSSTDYRKLCNQIEALKEKGYDVEFKDPVYAHKNFKRTVMNGCLAGIHILSISSNGLVYPCTKLKYSVGDIKRNNISEIWKNSRILNMLRNRRLKGKCKKCLDKISCGGCRAAAYAEYSDIFAEDPLCIR